MKIINVIASVVLTVLPISSLVLPVQAATASNSQLGANGGSSNPYHRSYDRVDGQAAVNSWTVRQAPKAKGQYSCGFNELSTKLERKVCGGHRI